MEDKTITMEFRQSKTTKGTVVFEEMRQDDERPHIFYLLRRTYEALGRPESLVMTLEVD